MLPSVAVLRRMRAVIPVCRDATSRPTDTVQNSSLLFRIRDSLVSCSELWLYDKKHCRETTLKINGGCSSYRLLAVPLKRRKGKNHSDDREVIRKTFRRQMTSSKFMTKLLSAWSSYVGGTDADAAGLILEHFARAYPEEYVSNFASTTRKVDRMNGPKEPELPEGFVDYDGTRTIGWNARYGALKAYAEEHGHANPRGKEDLAKWVSNQRHEFRAGKLSGRRRELLDDVGVTWEVVRTLPDYQGRPEINRAIACKMKWPNLSLRECMHVGGLRDDELDAVKDQKHTWRTGYVVVKDFMKQKIKGYEGARRTGSRVEIERLLGILSGDDEDRLEQVFGENCDLLVDYLKAAEGRGPDWTEERTVRRKRKRAEEEKVQTEEEGESDEGGEPSRRETASALMGISGGPIEGGSPWRRADAIEHLEQQHGGPHGRVASNMQRFTNWMESFDMT
ncbi:hypothetical protein THAOC_00138 [Thalassiosira oceanica]|uniref:Helicase-associated domain-containing protein n=1 Tax=Thalassiosira oceanica TaxID=159749 RepID=K0TJX3_THAOC|nr:hypothetical protein THAOC_00138 [Thalassiosira oceanica]|eukprot:EJK77990.1 hypothetical protein THAOC_00138 [Thalassiosira oceanica]